jgi:CheY-like chemotaxis protein
MAPPLVMLVDDHPDGREMYAHFLGLSGFRVLQAVDAASALALAAAGPLPSIVVTDVRMPGPVSAAALCREFQRQGVPVVVLTGLIPGREHAEMKAAGCPAILMKPLSPDDLIAQLLRLLPQTPSS